MTKSLFTLTALTSLFLLASCQEGSEKSNAVATEQSATKTTLINKVDLPCKAASPMIKDKSKIKKMLMDSGKITADMSEEMANKVVNNYIKNKQEAFKRCKK